MIISSPANVNISYHSEIRWLFCYANVWWIFCKYSEDQPCSVDAPNLEVRNDRLRRQQTLGTEARTTTTGEMPSLTGPTFEASCASSGGTFGFGEGNNRATHTTWETSGTSALGRCRPGVSKDFRPPGADGSNKGMTAMSVTYVPTAREQSKFPICRRVCQATARAKDTLVPCLLFAVAHTDDCK